MFEGWDVRVIGNDISRRVLQVARRGNYGNASFRSMIDNYQQYFVGVRRGSHGAGRHSQPCATSPISTFSMRRATV